MKTFNICALLASLLIVPTSSVAQFATNPYSVALDNTLNNFVSVGQPRFFVQSRSVNVGNSAVQSGAIGNSQSTDLRVLVRGGDQIKFDFRTSTEPTYDSLVLVVADQNGFVLDTPFFYSGFINWRTQTFTIPGNGRRILAWVYQKDESLSFGEDAVWIDNVRITRDGVEVNAAQTNFPIGVMPAIINLLLDTP